MAYITISAIARLIRLAEGGGRLMAASAIVEDVELSETRVVEYVVMASDIE